MSSQPSEVRQKYIDKMEFRNAIGKAIDDSQAKTQLNTNLIRWASPTLVRENGAMVRRFSDKFLAYCSNPDNERYVQGKSPNQVSIEKINACNAILTFEAENRKLLRNDLALVEAELKDLRLQLPPAEQVLNLAELQALQSGTTEPARFDESQAAKLAAADSTTADAEAALDAAIDNAVRS